jgi:hypothetical protein
MMRRWILLVGVATAVLAGGCNDFNTTIGTPTNSSTISFLSPSGANAGGGAFTLTVEGSGFANNSVVEWNGSDRVTTFLSSNELLAQITTADVAKAGTVNVLVDTPGTAISNPSEGENQIETSNVLQFVIQAAGAVPAVITSISPTTETAGGPAFLLTVNGTGFIQPVTSGANQTVGSSIQWNGSAITSNCAAMGGTLVPTSVNTAGTQATIMVPACSIATAEAAPGARVTVFNPPSGNPATGGGTSNTFFVTVTGGGANAKKEASGLVAGLESGATSLSPAISADTRYVAFVAPVPDPTVDASTGTDNVYVRDTCAGAAAGCVPATTLISVAADGISAADGASASPSMSADGRYVTFVSLADNLVAGGASGLGDIFVRDTCVGATSGCTPTTTLISVAANGSFANGASDSPSISAGGRYVVFSSIATNLISGGAATTTPEIYLRDLCVGAPPGCQATTIQLSVSSATASSP